MRGIIIEKKWHSAIVMTNNGQFRRLYFPFGREVADEVVLSRQPRMQFAVAAMAVFLLVAGLVGYNTRFQSAAYGFVSIEVNPAAEFQINQYGVVVEAVPEPAKDAAPAEIVSEEAKPEPVAEPAVESETKAAVPNGAAGETAEKPAKAGPDDAAETDAAPKENALPTDEAKEEPRQPPIPDDPGVDPDEEKEREPSRFRLF